MNPIGGHAALVAQPRAQRPAALRSPAGWPRIAAVPKLEAEAG